MLGVWWVWIYTCWVTNWLDPERVPVRLCLFALMVAGLVMSVSIPEAFGTRGLYFAGAYVFMHVFRTLFFLWAVRGGRTVLTRNFQRILVWLVASGAVGSPAVSRPAGHATPGGSPRSRSRFSGPGSISTSRSGAITHRRLERPRRAHGGALRTLRHHRARRVAARHRRDVRRAGLDPDDLQRPSWSPCWEAS